jgi:tetratricopeptide (TPR) repeat protein
VTSAQFSPEGKRIVTASQDGTARVWDAQSGQQLAELQHGNLVAVISAQFSPDGRRILTVSRDGTAPVWDAQSGQQLTQLGGEVKSAQFSPDGNRILTVSETSARVWDAATGQPLTEPLQNNTPVLSAQFSPDGKRIVTATFGGGARVWDAQTGQQLMEPLLHSRTPRPGEFNRGSNRGLVVAVRSSVNFAQFSPDGKRIVTASDDGTARVWDVAPSQGDHPAWLPQLAEAISGLALNKQGLLEPTAINCVEVINRLRQELNNDRKNDDWALWGRWFLADPLTRTISPFSEQTFHEYIEERIAERTEDSLDEAERMAGDDDPSLKRIAQARATLGQPTQAARLSDEAAALVSEGKMAEADAKYDEALAIARNAGRSEQAATVLAMKTLAGSYFSAGHGKEAIAVLAKACEADPSDTDASLTLATWQTWFGQDADYDVTRHRLVQQAEATDQAGTAERAAKAACLRPSTDDVLLTNAVNLAQRGVELGRNSELLPWYQLSFGLAQYRAGHYAAAEQTLAAAERAFGEFHEMMGIARLFRAMTLFRLHRTDDARHLFTQAAAEIPPPPQDGGKPLVDGKAASHDVLICWLAYKEAGSTLKEPASVK